MKLTSIVKSTALFLTVLGSVNLLSSCGGGKDKSKSQAGAKQPQPYNVISLQNSSTTLYAEYPAKLEGVMDIDIRPKIDGYIEKIYVDEGQPVRVGQILFKINNPQFAQDVNSTTAMIASAEAAVASAKLQVEKTKPLVTQGIISHYELESAQLNLKAQQANLAQARATNNNSKINLNYTTVTSPVNGVVGTLPYRIGSYVNSATAEPLTTISDISKIYAYFSINEKQQLAFAENAPGKTFQDKIKQMPAISLILSNGNEYDEKGKIETVSGQINSQTGSFNVRAGFKNDKNLLRSGSSASIKIPTYVNNVILIPQKATTELQNKRLAYIVSDSNTVKAVEIQVREVPGGQYYVVDNGLKENDKLIVEGIGILTEGTKIQPKLVAADSVLKLNK